MDIINILQQITQYLMNDDLYEDERDKMKTRTKCLRRWTWVSCGQEVDRFVTEKEKGGRDGCR